MPVILRRPFGSTLVAASVIALLIAGCSGSSATQAPAASSAAPAASSAESAAPATEAPAAATEAPATEAPATEAPATGDLSGAAGNLANITSYKFTMTMKGGSLGSMLGGQPMTGTVTLKPQKAAQMSFMGMEVVEIEGKTWVKLGDTWMSGDADSSASMADSFAPEKMFGSTLSDAAVEGYAPVGDEQKNGVNATHYRADASLLNEYSSLFGVEGNATWAADVWIAKDGGYPVSMKVSATGGTEAFEMTFDITNINDPANKVEQPA